MCVNLNEYELLAWPSVVGRYRHFLHVLNVLLICKVNFEKKSRTSHWEIFISCTSWEIMWWCYKTLLSNLQFIICQVAAYGRLKTEENFKLLDLKVVMVAYERWSLTRGSKYGDLTGKLSVLWKNGCWGEVVATGDLTVLLKCRPCLFNSSQIWNLYIENR